jgi:hypothetical protein
MVRLLLRTSFERLEVRLASSLALQLQISVEFASLAPGASTLLWPFADFQRLDLKNLSIPFTPETKDALPSFVDQA